MKRIIIGLFIATLLVIAVILLSSCGATVSAKVLTVDGCEYVTVIRGLTTGQASGIVHKENCKNPIHD